MRERKGQMTYSILGVVAFLATLIVVIVLLATLMEYKLSQTIRHNEMRLDAQLVSHQLVFSSGYYCGIECTSRWEEYFLDPSHVENLSQVLYLGLAEPGIPYHVSMEKYSCLLNMTNASSANYLAVKNHLGLRYDFYIRLHNSTGAIPGTGIGRAPNGTTSVPAWRVVNNGTDILMMEVVLWE